MIRLKIFVQQLCEVKLDWDEPLIDQLLEEWNHISLSLCESRTFSSPRCYLDGVGEQSLSYNLCGFCDASLKAYAAVVYLCIKTPSGRHIRFAVSKTCVAPLKTQTIPRLELLSALLLARLMDSISQAFQDEITLTKSCCFSNSMVAVCWIQGVEKVWKPFVQNRVAEIRNLLPPECWRHCPGRDNPADIASRGCTPCQLSSG